ncbi:DUF2637 domain-containing protein [Streptomyces sp. NPDC101455]|uniref:DUF2637 domain-containing protein n=1 Tax=Streptomyces sp. NPDC101455 TaxID=3366142 RepID=UPI0038093250
MRDPVIGVRATMESNVTTTSHEQRRRVAALSRVQTILATVIVFGAVVIAGIGFAGSYKAVQQLAADKGFGSFSHVYPIGVDAGIVVLLSIDLLLSWIRMPFPLLRQTAWLLTGSTVAFNAAAAYGDPLAVSMHAVIPVLFVTTVEAARHAVAEFAEIGSGRHMDSIRLSRWVLDPVSTFLMWRRMKLYELRNYDNVVKLEQDRLIYQARLKARFGRKWRRKAPVEHILPLKFARYGVPIGPTLAKLLEADASAPPWQAETPPPSSATEPPSDGTTEAVPPQAPRMPAVASASAEERVPPSMPPAHSQGRGSGRDAVRLAYDALPAPDRELSDRKLAGSLAPVLKLSENTVRVYLNALRRERRS